MLDLGPAILDLLYQLNKLELSTYESLPIGFYHCCGGGRFRDSDAPLTRTALRGGIALSLGVQVHSNIVLASDYHFVCETLGVE